MNQTDISGVSSQKDLLGVVADFNAAAARREFTIYRYGNRMMGESDQPLN